MYFGFFFGFLVPQSLKFSTLDFFFTFSYQILTTDPPLSLSVVMWSHNGCDLNVFEVLLPTPR